MKRIAAVMLLALVTALLSSQAVAQLPYTNWDFTIHARTATLSDSLARMGVRTDATADFENAYDIPRPPRSPSGNYLEVYFPHSGGSYPPILGTRYATDFQGTTDPVWSFSVECSASGSLTLLWDSAYVNSIEPRVQLFLVDIGSGTKVNMRVAGRYTFSYATKRNFQVVGAVKVDLTYLMEGFWNGSSQVQDTVTGYLANGTTPYAPIDSARTVLSSSGDGLLVFSSAPTGSYYVVIRHRNHIALWTAAAQPLTNGTTTMGSYDFSSGPGTAYGSGALKPEGGVYVSWGGDVNQDGVVDFLDRNVTWNNRTLPGYLSSDCNGSNLTDGTDYGIVLANRLKIEQRP
jgi:hypothetical protein